MDANDGWTLQDGIASPLLANTALDGMERLFGAEGRRPGFRSRYFDAKWNFVDGRIRLARHNDTPVTRHSKVQGKCSPLDPDDQPYWEERQQRRMKVMMHSPMRLALLRRQDFQCAMCRVGFDPDEDLPLIDEHHDIPQHCGGSDQIDNLQLVHRWYHYGPHARIGYRAAEGLSWITGDRHVRF